MSAARLEGVIQSEIEAAIGAEPDLLLLRNTVGTGKYYDDQGNVRFVTYGLGKGSPDLVGLLRGANGVAVWFCLEVKAAGRYVRFQPTQEPTIEQWRSFGALVYVVTSAQEARAALADARKTVAA